MAIDAFVKFGTGTGTGPSGTPLPAISGDSDDDAHYWWCELRDCSFDLENAVQDKSADDGSQSAKPADQQATFKPVSLQKRVDWATTSLFYKCCEAAKAKDSKVTAQEGADEPGKIDIITVEVCRPVGDGKIPFVTVRYYDVRVTHFHIDVSGPEPSESITFEFSSVQFEYTQTDPFTNKKKGDPKPTAKLTNNPSQDDAGGTGGAAQTGPSDGATGAQGAAPAAAVPTHAVVPAAADGSHVGVQSPTDTMVQTLVPGYSSGTGPGVMSN